MPPAPVECISRRFCLDPNPSSVLIFLSLRDRRSPNSFRPSTEPSSVLVFDLSSRSLLSVFPFSLSLVHSYRSLHLLKTQ